MLHPDRSATARLLVVLALLLPLPLRAQAPATETRALHPWQVPGPRLSAEAYFTNLKDGDRIETPYLVKFGLSGGWGLAPIAQAGQGKSGHHHLLVNRDLPLNFKEALPFNDQYIHFGKGQMETVLTLPPGEYTLRMLLADQQHLPHFVYSKPTKITVTRKNDTPPASLQKKGIEIGLDAPSARAPVRVQFHASMLDVAQMGQKIANTGHFRLTVTGEGSNAAPAVMDFVDGETEVWLAPPAGRYTLKLDMLDNADGRKPMAEPVTAKLEVR
ncbi:DUF4399 domain-containing protein [Hydrogenophaga intermedia]|uniref:DUF4399 domain-containing protein n=1 Tax=Hydrogenophaga intermedia TaxID=65786 RepID=UPI0020436505|nr:DUF4399 domain-containing protein [Hydrogenophaga intermedia]MCM3565136.1 DUF4399 domain-containing protein [Hydrogenophaga intermedia]